MLRQLGCKSTTGIVEGYDRTTRKIAERSREDNTLMGITTAVTQFVMFLHETGIPLAALKVQDPNANNWPADRVNFHMALLTSFCTKVTATHKTAATCKKYAGQVSNHWYRQYRVPLWTDAMFKDLKPYMDGLFKIKAYVADKRLGLSAPDVLVITNTLKIWSKLHLPITARGLKWKWGGHFTSTVSASHIFAYGAAMRYGEATLPNGKIWDPVDNLSRGDVEITDGIKGGPRLMKLKPPRFKVANRHSSEYITEEIHPDDPLNWPAAILRMMTLDPVEPKWRALTPLFRDTRHLIRDPATGRFPPGAAVHGGGDALPYRLMLTVLRKAIDAETGPGSWFEGRPAKGFGLHSFRIGRMNDYVDAGASYFVVSAAGRWTSQSVMDYHRMQQSTANRWAYRATQCALGRAATATGIESPAATQAVITDGAACFEHNGPVGITARPHTAITAVAAGIDWALVQSDPPRPKKSTVTLDGWVLRLAPPV